MDPLEVELNKAKDQLETVQFESLRKSDPYEQQIESLKRQLNFGQHVTKAWLKMYEILLITPLGRYLISLPSPIRGFFNAELPGAFLFATNHFLKSNKQGLEFVVSSFYPQNQQGDFIGDQFGLLKKYPERSLVGRVKTTQGVFWSNGDLTNPAVPPILVQLARAKLGSIDLYTADGGFDVVGRENLQEKLSIPLIRGEIETGFRALRVGGAFVLKIFTFFTLEMEGFLEAIKHSFDYFELFKPTTSAPMNSELYVIAIGYHGNGTSVTSQMTVLSPQLQAERTKYTKKQIEELEKFVSGKGQTVSRFDVNWVTPINPGQRI